MPHAPDGLADNGGGPLRPWLGTQNWRVKPRIAAVHRDQILDPARCTLSVTKAPYPNRRAAHIVWPGKTMPLLDQRSSRETLRPFEFPRAASRPREKQNLAGRAFV